MCVECPYQLCWQCLPPSCLSILKGGVGWLYAMALVMVNEMFGISLNFCWLFGFIDEVFCGLWSLNVVGCHLHIMHQTCGGVFKRSNWAQYANKWLVSLDAHEAKNSREFLVGRKLWLVLMNSLVTFFSLCRELELLVRSYARCVHQRHIGI